MLNPASTSLAHRVVSASGRHMSMLWLLNTQCLYLLKGTDHMTPVILYASVGHHLKATVHDRPVEQIVTH